jgi:hypothetical protein
MNGDGPGAVGGQVTREQAAEILGASRDKHGLAPDAVIRHGPCLPVSERPPLAAFPMRKDIVHDFTIKLQNLTLHVSNLKQ